MYSLTIALTRSYVGTDADEGVRVAVKLLLERDDDGLQSARLASDEAGHLADVGVVQRRVDLVQHEERSRLVAVTRTKISSTDRDTETRRPRSPVDGEEQRQSGHRFLASGQVGHGLEALARRHAVVVDAVQVGLLGVLRSQERLRRLVLGQRLFGFSIAIQQTTKSFSEIEGRKTIQVSRNVYDSFWSTYKVHIIRNIISKIRLPITSCVFQV